MSTILMTSPRDFVLRSRTDHVINFTGGEPTPVPDNVYAEAIAVNIVPHVRPDTEKPVFEMAQAQITGTLRDALVFEAIDGIVDRNDSEQFTGGGVPRADIVSKATGLNVSSSEMAAFYSRYKELKSTNGDLPRHPQTELVTELQSLSTRKQFEAFASENGLDMPQIGTRSLKELKQALLYSVVNQRAAPVSNDDYVKPSTLTED